MTSAITSSTTLWAQASKEWVIPAKPKPGRKPKKDTPAPPIDKDNEVDSKGRRVQNRAAQRAFRERKQSQLTDLQARVQSYEQGEMERNVALQNIAKRLKEENEILRRENSALLEEISKLRTEKSPEAERKRWREDSTNSYACNDTISRKRIKTDPLSALSPDNIPSAMSLLPSPSSLASSPGSDNDPYSPISLSARSPNPQVYSQPPQQPMASLFSGYVGKVPGCMNENRSSFDQSFDMVDCGFCSDDMSCMCRELALQQVAARIVHSEVPGSTSVPNHTSIAPPSPPEVKMESRGSISINSTPQIPPATAPMNSLPMSNGPSILDNLPAYAPPVPLPRRRQPHQGTPAPIFPVYSAQSLRSTRPGSPNCTGDPLNCLACADDPFGKAFCAALGSSVKQCVNCPNGGSISNLVRGCGGRGNPSPCGGAGPSSGRATSSASRTDPQSAASSPGHLSSSSNETISCNNAWAQLKSHPNIVFADLAMLADVVARRSKCTGPRVILSSDSELNVGRQSDLRGPQGSDDMPILLTDPHAQYHDHAQQVVVQSGSPLHSGVAVYCGRQRVVEVQAEGVRDALALLDGQFQRN